MRDPGLAGLWPFPNPNVLQRAECGRIVSVEHLILPEQPAYDLEIEDDAGYVAEGFVVHNCEWCRCMDGQVVSVSRATDNLDRAEALADPEGVKDALPWVSEGTEPDGTRVSYIKQDGKRIILAEILKPAYGTQGRGEYKFRMDPAKLVDSGVGLPPAHAYCYCYTSLAE